MSWARLLHLFLKASGERGLCFPSMGGMGWVLPWSLAALLGSLGISPSSEVVSPGLNGLRCDRGSGSHVGS